VPVVPTRESMMDAAPMMRVSDDDAPQSQPQQQQQGRA